MSRWLRLSVLLSLAWGCVSSGTGYLQSVVPREDRPFLIPPSAGYPRSLGPVTQRRLDEAHQTLVQTGDRGPAEALAAELLARSDGLDAAIVLASQADFVARAYEAANVRLKAVVTEYPGYGAAQLLYGRSAEKLGQLVEALEAYTSIAAESPVARARAAELEPRAVEIMVERIEDALAKGVTTEAQLSLERLQGLAPEHDQTLAATIAVAAVMEDFDSELEAWRRLSERSDMDRSQIELRAQLELEVGDAATGMRLLEELAADYPAAPELEEKLAEARFIWRLQLLPPEVRRLSEEPELTRGDFATMLFWLFPEVRYGRVSGARIANDILDNPHREQIVRVVNLGLMDVDSSLHRFEPDRAVTRAEAIASMLHLLARRTPPYACLGQGGGRPPSSTPRLCAAAANCALIEEPEDCLPGAFLSGTEALKLSRRAQEVLGVE